ncbi:MAG: sugar kinase [Microscillaceae bacterium]|nr:sugar kinase [Microscillaceae bacterium]
MSLLVVGTVAFDSIETPFGKAERIIGGSGTFISLAASYFAPSVNLVAVVGEDFPPEKIEMFKAHGIQTEGLQIKEGENSFFWAGKYHLDLNTRDTLATELNVLADFDPVIPASYQNADFLLLGNLVPKIQQTVIERLQQRPKLIMMDTMNFWISSALDELRAVLKMVDLLSVNDEEARQLTGEYSLVKAAKAILKMGPRYVIIKKGEHGAMLFYEDQIFYAPALPLEDVFDPTGAGDTFAGGFMGYLAQSGDISFENMKRAIIYGSALASFCVEKFGTEALEYLLPSTIENRVSEFVDLVQFEIQLD